MREDMASKKREIKGNLLPTNATDNHGIVKAADVAQEYVLCNSQSADPWSTTIINAATGITIWSHKGNETTNVAASQAVVYNNEYLLLPTANQPGMYMIGLHTRDKTVIRHALPAIVKCIAVHPSNEILCAAIDGHIYTWMTCNGRLVSIVSAHYQSITCMKFTPKGHLLVSAGKDGIVHVSPLSRFLSDDEKVDDNMTAAPVTSTQIYRTFQAHTLPIEHIFVSCAGGSDTQMRIVTASADRTVKLLDVASHSCLMTCTLDVSPSCVCMDSTETRILIGTHSGVIVPISLYSNVEKQYNIVTAVDHNVALFKGHLSRVSSIDISIDSMLCVSGDVTGNIRVWHTLSRQCMRQLNMKGAITTLQFIPPFPCLSSTSNDSRIPPTSLAQLQRSFASQESGSRIGQVALSTHANIRQTVLDELEQMLQLSCVGDAGETNATQKLTCSDRANDAPESECNTDDVDVQTCTDVNKLRLVLSKACAENKRLFEFAREQTQLVAQLREKSPKTRNVANVTTTGVELAQSSSSASTNPTEQRKKRLSVTEATKGERKVAEAMTPVQQNHQDMETIVLDDDDEGGDYNTKAQHAATRTKQKKKNNKKRKRDLPIEQTTNVTQNEVRSMKQMRFSQLTAAPPPQHITNSNNQHMSKKKQTNTNYNEQRLLADKKSRKMRFHLNRLQNGNG